MQMKGQQFQSLSTAILRIWAGAEVTVSGYLIDLPYFTSSKGEELCLLLQTMLLVTTMPLREQA